MRSLKILLLALLLASVGTSCAVVSLSRWREPQISLQGRQVDVLFYKEGHIEKRGSLPADSPGTKALNALLESKRGGWKWSVVTYAPSIYIKCDDFSINVGRDLVVVNDAKGVQQVVSRITAEESERLSKAIEESVVPQAAPQPR